MVKAAAKKGVRRIIQFVDKTVYQNIPLQQKEKLSNALSDKQKQTLRKLFKTGKNQTALKKAARVRYKLTTLGIEKKALQELRFFYEDKEHPILQKAAAYELIQWHSNQESTADAEKVIEFADFILEIETDRTKVKRVSILAAEAYQKLGKLDAAKTIAKRLARSDFDTDVYLLNVNMTQNLDEKMQYMNHIFEHYGNAPVQLSKGHVFAYDGLETNVSGARPDSTSKVSVIMPAYNAGVSLRTAVQSVLKQTHQHLELLIVDDCSTDHTKQVAEAFAREDERVKVLQTPENSGAYTARNIALQQATGDYVTINDADDWSHAEKLAIQVKHLDAHPKVVGNFSNQARLSNDLQFYRRGKLGIFMFPNFSSFMFRRNQVMEKLGYWDSVRFAGDSEYMKRLKRVFGEKAVCYLDTAPLSFQRQTEDSLTGSSSFGFPGFFMGARQEYKEASEAAHAQMNDYYYPFPAEKRPFPIPDPMRPKRQAQKGKARHFDVIIASEFRLLGGTNMSNIEEIKVHKRAGLKTGLIQCSRYDLNSVEAINPKVRDEIDGESCEMIVYGEKVTCDTLIFRHPPALEDAQRYLPHVKATSVNVVVNQPPMRDYSEEGIRLYYIDHVAEQLNNWLGTSGTWYPIGPKIREVIERSHQAELQSIQWSQHDWVNIIDISEWSRQKRALSSPPIIGRHSRDQYVKWPENPEQLLRIYPESGEFQVAVLGGTRSVKKILGRQPKNWTVFEFGELEPKEFLQKIDVFVYYTHSEWIEAFGRVIFEAMAAGVPVVIDPSYRHLFGEAAIYAEPDRALEQVRSLTADQQRYEEQQKRAQEFVDQHFGYEQHVKRIGRGS